jgi:hypothetical protein
VCAGHVSSMWGDVVESVPLFLFLFDRHSHSVLPLPPEFDLYTTTSDHRLDRMKYRQDSF